MPCSNGVCTPNNAPKTNPSTTYPSAASNKALALKKAQAELKKAQKALALMKKNSLGNNAFGNIGNVPNIANQGPSSQNVNIQKPGWFSDSPDQLVNNPIYTQGQQQLMQALSQGGLKGLQGYNQFAGMQPTDYEHPGLAQLQQMAAQQLQPQQFDPNRYSFDPIEQQARQDFAQTTVPTIAERFSSMGGQRSSAFGQQLGQAASGLESQLAALRSGHLFKQGALEQGQQGLNQGLLGLNQAQQGVLQRQQALGQNQQQINQGQQGLNQNMQNLYAQLAQAGLTPLSNQMFIPGQASTWNKIQSYVTPAIANAGLNYATGGMYGGANALAGMFK